MMARLCGISPSSVSSAGTNCCGIKLGVILAFVLAAIGPENSPPTISCGAFLRFSAIRAR